MQAALYRTGRRMERVEVADPGCPGPGEVVVEVRACGICGSDLHVFRGAAKPLNFAGGHEFAGVVVMCGTGVEQLTPGQAVAIEPLFSCGVCGQCRSGGTNLCDRREFIGFRRHGGFARRVRVPARSAWPLPPGVSWETAALTEPLAVAMRAVRLAGVTGASAVAILGAGAIGLLSAVAARERGARAIVMAARYEHQVTAAARLGFPAVVVPQDADAAARLTAELGRRPDVVIEAVGGAAPEPVVDAIRLVRRGGNVVLTGIFTDTIAVPLTNAVRKEVVLRGSYCYGHQDLPGDFPAALAVLARGDGDLKTLITHRYPAESIQEAFETAASKTSGAIKVLVVSGGEDGLH